MANFNSLFLMPTGLAIGLIAGIAVVAVVLGVLLLLEKKNAKQIGIKKSEIDKMRAEAEQECKALKKEAILEAKEQDIKLRHEFENETREKKAELNKMEQRLVQKEELLNKKGCLNP